MNKLLVVLIAGAFATLAAAQNAPMKPTAKQRQQDVGSVTGAAANSNTGATTAKEQAANVRASKEVSKMTRAEKEAFAKEINKQMLNPDNPSGSVSGTAAMQKETTAVSKGQPKANTELKSKEGQKQLSHELNKASQGGGGK